MQNKLIAHILLMKQGKYLLIKRSKVKRGRPNFYPGYWDVPGGTVEEGELPRDAAIRETFEETGQRVTIAKVIHEDSNYDKDRETIFTRIVYLGEINGDNDVILDPEEHTKFKFVEKLDPNDKVVNYLKKIFTELCL
ncbi:NUDIX hydrolase [Enterococcus sp. BWB1-3]|nr:NUDIX hydrolase [Enterococcus sp. BWB1-3]